MLCTGVAEKGEGAEEGVVLEKSEAARSSRDLDVDRRRRDGASFSWYRRMGPSMVYGVENGWRMGWVARGKARGGRWWVAVARHVVGAQNI